MKQFGSFIFDMERQCLRHVDTNEEIEIDLKLFELLSLFIAQSNTIISRQTILEHLWAGSIVTDNAINKLIANLRSILGDDAKAPRYISTVPKRGYRWICDVVSIEESTSEKNTNHEIAEASEGHQPVLSQTNWRRPKYSSHLIFILLFVLIGISLWGMLGEHGERESSHTVALTRASGLELSARMHPNGKHLYYLKQHEGRQSNELWIKNLETAVVKRANTAGANMSHIISVNDEDANTTSLLYLDKNQNNCGVNKATFLKPSYTIKTIKTLFDCSDKRIKDIDFNAKQQIIYYAAQPKNFWPNQVYAYDLNTKKHTLITQTEPTGWGHHNIDVSPDGNKLLIMSTKSDYKTQVLSLNLLTHEITDGVEFNKPVREAIWHHDSQRINYFSTAPAQQIIQSDFNGSNAFVMVSVTEELSANMSLFPDGKNLLFSTQNKNYNNRWLSASERENVLDNSTVSDFYPALFHHSEQILFISNRSGRRQLYITGSGGELANIVTNFSQSHWLGYVRVSEDDNDILLNVDNMVYQLPASKLNERKPLTSLANEYLIYASQNPIISLDWLSKDHVAVTAVNNGTPELVIVNVAKGAIQNHQSRWAYGLSDREFPEGFYLVEKFTNRLYRAGSLAMANTISEDGGLLEDTGVTLPNEFYHIKIDGKFLYYVTTEQDKEFLNSVPLNHLENKIQMRLNDFSSYDVSNGRIILSDLEKYEGDIHRTVH